MINRNQIESILKINGVTPASADEQIRSVLLSARYSKDEVDTAIMVLRENTKTNKTHVDGLHKVFRTNEALNSSEISSLLGIDLDVSSANVSTSRKRDLSGIQYAFVWFISVIIAAAAIVLYMYMYEVGIFHQSSGLFNTDVI